MCPAAPLCEPFLDDLPVWRDRERYAPAALDQIKDSLWERPVGLTDAFGSRPLSK